MTLKKKIFLSSFISFITISTLVLAGYANLIKTKKEIRFLELSDILSSKSLQLRRHEKNFFLYRDIKEIKYVHTYLKDLKTILKDTKTTYSTEDLLNLEINIEEYEKTFKRIELIAGNFEKEFEKLKPLLSENSGLLQLTESTYIERPLVNAEILEKFIPLDISKPSIRNLQELNTEIIALRKIGEEILNISTALDKSAREKVEKYISFLQTVAIFLFPLFLLIGLGTSFIINHDILSRLKILTGAIEKAGKGEFSSLPIPAKQDEVGELISKMENGLIARDDEIRNKNEELLLSKKLASLGTLASGVAHELNNPLNNIYLAAQTLSKKINFATYPGIINESVKDVFSQTFRMKRIVSDLLEYSRQRIPEPALFNIVDFIEDLFQLLKDYGVMADVKYNITGDKDIKVHADNGLLHQVFINLCGNAVDAMEGHGTIEITINRVKTDVQIKFTDTGKGIPAEDISKIFDPFFTNKEKGTGLGLAIVYSIIESHNGKIVVKSEPDKGTEFIITLPGE